MPKIVEDKTIFDAAIQTVVERGYAGATTRQIADAAGISEVTLFRRYGNKGELMRRAVAATAESMELDEAIRYTGDLTADLRRVLALYQGVARQRSRFLTIILSELPRHPELSPLVEIPLNVMARVNQLLTRYQAEGMLAPEPPFQAVAGLLGPLFTLAMLNGQPGVEFPPLDLDRHVTLFLNGRRPSQAGQ